jgi:hypothetical protein
MTAAAVWAGRKDALAGWTLARLVNRTDVWGGYNPLEDVGRKYPKPDGTEGEIGSQTTRPLPSQRGKLFLSAHFLKNHFAGTRREHIVGLHSTSPENTSKWGALDIDHHGLTSTAPEVNWRAALAWYDALLSRGFKPLLTDSNGKGGYHLLVIFAEPVPTRRAYHFLRGLVSDHAKYGMARAPETFPKQPMIPSGRYGNWLRLPGKHHTRDHWSQVWGGSRWLDGVGAAEFILALTGDQPGLVPEPPPQEPARQRAAQPRMLDGERLAMRIVAYMSRLPHLGAGQGRDGVAYSFAAWLVRDMALSDEAALAWLERWDAGNRPPKGAKALSEILANARQYGRNEVGCGIGGTVRHGRVVLRAEMGVRL